MRRWVLKAGLGLALLAGLAGAAQAQDSERDFFRGKTIRIVVGSGVGGGYDVYARLIAPYLSRALGATVVVENQPGAGGHYLAQPALCQPARRAHHVFCQWHIGGFCTDHGPAGPAL
jgi:tripartite-type tricarboxylate transporter receptor subunit TctC